mgnify:CR=1 FL=1
MKAVAVFLLGVAVIVAGAVIRSCNDAPITQLLNSWCGAPPRSLTFAHEHCAGCVLIAAGVGLIAVAPLLLAWTQPAHAKAPR